MVAPRSRCYVTRLYYVKIENRPFLYLFKDLNRNRSNITLQCIANITIITIKQHLNKRVVIMENNKSIIGVTDIWLG